MRIIEQLVYKITGDNSEFDRSIDKSETKVSKFGSVADKMFAGVTVAAIGMVVKKMGDMVISSANALDRVDKLSQKIGLSRVAFQEWDYILGQSGASVEGLQMGLKTLSGAADEASKGNKQYKDSFDKLGVSVIDVNGNMKDQETLFNEVFSALADMENQTERTAIASDLLGRSATELAPTLNTSKEEIEQLRQEAHDLGVVYSDEVVDAGVALGDNIDRLKKSFDALKTNALAPIIGLAVTFTNKLLGQDSASKGLEESYGDLKTAVSNYNTVLEESKGKTDAITQATIEQAEAARGAALALLGSEYDDAKEKSARYEKTIANLSKAMKNESIATKSYTDTLGISLDELANSSLTEQTITGKLLDSRKFSNNQIMSFLETLRTYKDQQDAITEANKDKIESDAKVLQFVNQLTVGYLNNDDAAKLLLATYPEIQQKVLDNVDAYKKEQKATEDAAEAFKAYENMTSEEISNAIKQLSLEEKTLTNGKLIELLQKKKIELAREVAKAADDLAGKEKARNEIVEAGNKAMESAEQYALALGSSYDLNAQKVSILETTIKALIDSGLTAEDKAVADLIAQLKALKTTTKEVTAAYAEIEKSRMTDKEKALKAIQEQADAYRKAGVAEADVAKWQSEQIKKYQDEETKTRADAYKLLESYSLYEKDKAIANIQAQADKFLEAGVSEVDVEKWKTSELGKLQEEQAAKAEEEAERVRKAWEDATFSMLGSVTSIWGSINQVQANQNDAEIQRIEEQNEAAIEAAKARGASEEELAELEKSLQADLNETKNQYAQEEAKRKKAQATFQAIIDTASAVIGFLANPGGWAGVGLSAMAVGTGAAQIAAIQSEPLPSYDVGSIRIPETQTATVHKDEMILTAPQAEQARREGITIAPTNKAGGNSVNLVIYLDGKEIARNTIDNLNSGSVGTIKARVVK